MCICFVLSGCRCSPWCLICTVTSQVNYCGGAITISANSPPVMEQSVTTAAMWCSFTAAVWHCFTAAVWCSFTVAVWCSFTVAVWCSFTVAVWCSFTVAMWCSCMLLVLCVASTMYRRSLRVCCWYCVCCW